MTFPLEWAGPASGLLCGSIFGYVLENGGLGDGCRLTGQLRLRDWTVFNVMFTAIIVAAAGLQILEALGLLDSTAIYTPTLYLGATLLGGACVGIGMGVGGYCPGTSVVATCEGRIDGAFFFGGLLLGTLMFSMVYARITPLLHAMPGPDSQTLVQLFGIPAWAILALLAVVAAGVGGFTRNVGKAAVGSVKA